MASRIVRHRIELFLLDNGDMHAVLFVSQGRPVLTDVLGRLVWVAASALWQLGEIGQLPGEEQMMAKNKPT